MSDVRRLLILVFAVESAWAIYLVSQNLSEPPLPQIDASRLDSLTVKDLEQLRSTINLARSEDWQRYGEALLGTGYYVAAEQCFHQATRIDPENLQAEYARGFCLERTGETQRAIAVLTHTAQNADINLRTTCWYQIGRCQLREENLELAEAAFREIPDSTPAVYQLAKLLTRTGRAKEAAPLIDTELRAYPNSLKLLQLKMHVAEELGETALVANMRDRENRSEYQLVLEYGQSFIGMFASRVGLSKLLSKALSLKERGSLEQRQVALNEALNVILPNQLWQYRSVILAAAHVELGLGNIPESAKLTETIEAHTRGGIDLLELKALLAEAQGDHEKSVEYWQMICDIKPSSDAYLQLAQSNGLTDEERDHYTALSHFWNGLSLFRVNQVSEALSHFEPLKNQLSDNPMYWYYLGECFRLQKNTRAARAAYSTCLNIEPEYPFCRSRLNALSL